MHLNMTQQVFFWGGGRYHVTKSREAARGSGQELGGPTGGVIPRLELPVLVLMLDRAAGDLDFARSASVDERFDFRFSGVLSSVNKTD